MLERIRIQNFQKHERLQIDLHPAVTTIVGPTDAGKSSVIRAIKWVALNQPSGDAFVRDGADGTAVKLMVDGKTITRRRGGSRNEYRLDDNEYKAFGADVPKPVTDVLKITGVNFAMQLDAPFWLSETPGEVSRQLNAVVDLGVIDDVLSGIGSAVRKAQTVADVCQDRLATAEETEQELSWVPRAVGAFVGVCRAEGAKIALEATTATLRASIAWADRFIREQTKATQAASAGRMALEAGRELRRITKAKTGLSELIGTCTRLAAAATKVPDVKRLDELYKTCRQISDRRLDLRDRINEMKAASLRVYKGKQELMKTESEMAAATEGLCPVCGSEMD